MSNTKAFKQTAQTIKGSDKMPKRKYRKYESDSTRDIKLIRRIIKKKCPTLSVTMGKGTAYGWVDITSKDRGAVFTKKESQCLKSLGRNPGSNFDVISPEDTGKFIDYHMMKRAGIPLTGE